MNIKTTRAAAVGAMALALALSGCASGSVDGSAATAAASGSAGLTKVNYGMFPSNTVAALQVAIDKGYFEKQGIDLIGRGWAAARHSCPLATGGSTMLASPVHTRQSHTGPRCPHR
jgi:NitT/TauT family transport system substrate-binding protein